MNEEFMLKLLPALKGLRVYHRHDVMGINHIPRRGPAIVASTHSLATYDLLLLMACIYQETGRFPRSLVDNLFYKVPGLGPVMESLGCVAGSPQNAKSLLSNGEILCLAPGGMKESLRSGKNKYKIYWQNRKGFAKLALETGSPIILAACPSADDVYDVYDTKLSSFIYKRFKLPFFIAKGLGFTAIPKPVRLKHHLSAPIYPPSWDGKKPSGVVVDEFHAELVVKMENLLKKAVAEAHPASLRVGRPLEGR